MLFESSYESECYVGVGKAVVGVAAAESGAVDGDTCGNEAGGSAAACYDDAHVSGVYYSDSGGGGDVTAYCDD